MIKTTTLSTRQSQITPDELATWYTEHFPVIARWIHQQGGDLQLAKDFFQEAVLACLRKSDVLENPGAYLMRAVQFQWYRYQRKSQRLTSWPSELDIVEQQAVPIFEQRLEQLLRRAGERCLALLEGYYYARLNLHQLAQRLGFRSTHAVAVQKHKCLTRIRVIIHQKKWSYEKFTH